MSTDINDFSTGDIILFNGLYPASKIIDVVTQGKWSHVGMVVKDPNFLFNVDHKKGIFLYESDGKEFIDVDSGSKLFGVQLVDLKEKIDKYEGTIAYRKLLWNKPIEYFDDVLKVIYNTTYHKSYDWNVFDLLDPIIYKKFWILDKILHINHRKTDAFFCSSFVSYIYTQLGLLPQKTDWSLIYPDFFATINELEDGGKLDTLMIIKDSPKHKKEYLYDYDGEDTNL